MCLKIDPDVQLPQANTQGYCVGYKVIRTNNYPSYQHGIPYKKGIVESDRGSKELTESEQASKNILSGIHIFLDFQDAKIEVDHWNRDYHNEKIIKVYFKPEDVIATGYFYAYHIEGSDVIKFKTTVVMKVLVRSVKGITKP